MLIQFLIFNFILSFLIASFVYKNSKVYYTPCKYKDKNNKEIDIHKVFEVFHTHDELVFWKLWLGCFINFPWKFPVSLFIAITMKFHLQLILKLYKNTDTDPVQWKKMKRAISFWSTFFLYANGIRVLHKKVDCTEVYKKYLGEDYDFTDDKYSLLMSNHIGFFEVVVFMSIYSAGFMAKKDVADYYFVGPIATAMHCLYINRESQNSRQIIFDQLEERQKAFYSGKFLAPLAMFPEGTCTCGRNILRFKRGTFYALLPIKPLIINIYQESNYHLSVGAAAVVMSYIKNFCHSIEPMYVVDMPVIRPTEYMYEKFKDLSKEKWEIYALVVRKIYSEIGGLEESDMGLRDEKRYNYAMKYGVYDPDTDPNDPNYLKKKSEYTKEKID